MMSKSNIKNGKNLRFNPYNPSKGGSTIQYLRTEYTCVCVLSSKNTTIGLHLRNTKEPTNNH